MYKLCENFITTKAEHFEKENFIQGYPTKIF